MRCTVYTVTILCVKGYRTLSWMEVLLKQSQTKDRSLTVLLKNPIPPIILRNQPYYHSRIIGSELVTSPRNPKLWTSTAYQYVIVISLEQGLLVINTYDS
jgi:hypothetical protein